MTSRRELLSGGAALLAAATAAPALSLPEPRHPSIHRRYIDCTFGQLHLRIAQPMQEPRNRPLVLFHQTALSGRMFDRFMPLLATTRLVIAADTPGYGESDRPAERPSLAGYGDAILNALAREFSTKLDVIGYHTGAAIAADVASRRTEVERCVLVSIPYFSDDRRLALIEQIGKPKSIEDAYADDGSHLLPMWGGTFGVRPEGQSIEDAARLVAEKMRAGRHGEWALVSALEAELAPLFAAIAKPTLVIAPHDGLEDESRSAADLISGSQLIELPDHAYGLFDAAPGLLAEKITTFLDA